MATIHKGLRQKPRQKPRSSVLILVLCISAITLFLLFSSPLSTNGFSFSSLTLRNLSKSRNKRQHTLHDKYLYWGSRIDCPGKHCDSCAGLGHQESSLRCALEEAKFLGRTFVMPSRMCINPIHNGKGILHQSNNASSEERWADSSCAMESLYDLELISETVPVILDNSRMWYHVLMTSMKLGARGVAHVEGVSRVELKENNRYSNLLLINRTASPLSWFMECKDRKNRSAVMVPHSFLPSMAAEKLRDAAEKIQAILGDYDAIHVRRGDILKTRKDSHGVERTLHPHLDRDTHPESILCRIKNWVPPGRTLFIASNEKTPGFFSPLAIRYKLAYSSNFSDILNAVIEDNYQLFMVERLVLMGSKTFIKTYKEDDKDLSLTDDPKKNTKNWQIPVYTMDRDEEC
ncbi:Calcium ion binding [Melia azedarach]|uniref:Calcium ion binding n=1 Tax=Melia azedarach TaxID=155640 RepID=A0ACC1X5V4_MELAZ|nr:Calcium ion binding [Melia azedarach]